MSVDLQNVLFFDSDRGAMPVVHRVAVRHNRVQSVVAAEPLKDHQYLVRSSLRCHFARPAKDGGHGADATEQAKPEAAGADPQHVATRDTAVGQSSLGSHGVGLPMY